MLREFYRMKTLFYGYGFLPVVDVATLFRLAGLSVRPVVYLAFGDAIVELPVAVVVHYWADCAVDGESLPVYAQTGELAIKIGEVATLEAGII